MPPNQVANPQVNNARAEPTAVHHLPTTILSGQVTYTMPTPPATMATPPSQHFGTLPTMQLGNNTIQLGSAQPQQLLAASTLPPVPAQLHQQTVQGEYVDFTYIKPCLWTPRDNPHHNSLMSQKFHHFPHGWKPGTFTCQFC